MKISVVALCTAVAIALTGCGPGGSAASTPPYNGSPLFTSPDAGAATSGDVSPADAPAAAYCRQTHGEVEVRHAVYGSNGSQLLFLAGVKTFCQYTRKKDGSRIHILLSTLYTTKPTLAALAYILKPPVSGSCQGNPA